MATRSPLLRIHDMLESIRGIEKALAGKAMRDYERSWLLRSAVRHRGYFRSQPSSRPRPESTTQGCPLEGYRRIGNILRHDYQRVDASIIWKAVKDDLPPLKEALLALKASLK